MIDPQWLQNLITETKYDLLDIAKAGTIDRRAYLAGCALGGMCADPSDIKLSALGSMAAGAADMVIAALDTPVVEPTCGGCTKWTPACPGCNYGSCEHLASRTPAGFFCQAYEDRPGA